MQLDCGMYARYICNEKVKSSSWSSITAFNVSPKTLPTRLSAFERGELRLKELQIKIILSGQNELITTTSRHSI